MTEQNVACGITEESAMERVNYYINKIAAHSFAGTPTGAVLDDVMDSSGKMLRPRLLLYSGAFGSCAPARFNRLCMLAAMVELTHMASLIHDDIIDEAPCRRGKPSIQRKYGKDAAVYAGDFLIERVHYWQAKEQLTDAALLLSKTVERMCVGEIGQALCRYDPEVTVERYLQNIKGKTASLFAASCELGAREAGCSREEIGKLKRFGEYLGVMFQFRDDLLDFTSNGAAVGKKTHKDFLEGIYTLPVLLAMEHPEGRGRLLPVMEENARRVLSPDEIRQMEQDVIRCGGTARTIEEIHRYGMLAGEILDSLRNIPAANKIRRMLSQLEAV